MSIAVDLDELAAVVAEHDVAYLLTVGEEGRPHAVALRVGVDGAALVVDCGGGTAANARQRPLVSLVWPPVAPDGFSLIVDGEASVEQVGERWRVRVRPTSAVKHRPAPARD